ncbi:hypothetical protein QNH48_15485 [Neobacillus sp. YX16]|uniref:hypothetical protein n=1 Tax=Neobacillus sp. YX16 TaxID=3047874 RepID=UPI0024C43F31|nr:hypothetical protein [Neobacillus sp. YX16]WHZ00478.1 hypothetical protein QNH48_15485 [Neobacillus sp. YX16]
MEPKDIANLVLNVSDYSTNNFMQQIWRRLSILERHLVTARGDGKVTFTQISIPYMHHML